MKSAKKIALLIPAYNEEKCAKEKPAIFNETSPPMEGQSLLGRFGFFLASFIPRTRRYRGVF